MVRSFDDGSSEYLQVGSTPVSSHPLTLAGWFNTDDLTANQTVIGLANSATGVDYFVLQFGGSSYSDQVAFEVLDGSAVDGTCTTSSAASANTWHHACGVAASGSSRAVYLDGGSKGTDTAGLSAHSTNTIGIGRNSDSTPSDYFSGSVAEVGIWNVALTDAEVAVLAAGYSPLFVRPASLVFYLPLVRDADEDIVGGRSLTPFNSPTIGAHPRVIMPAGQSWVFVPSATGAFFQSAAGTLTTAGATVRQTATTQAGTLTSAGAVLKQATVSYAGTLTSAGAVALETALNYAGTLTSSGAVSTAITFAAALAGTLTNAGAVVMETAVSYGGTLTTAGAAVKEIALSYAGTLSTSGAVSAVKTFVQAIAGTLSTAGAVTRQTATSVAGTLTTSGVSLKETVLAFAGTLTTAGAVAAVKTFTQAIAGTLTTAGAIVKEAAINPAGTLTTAGDVAKETATALAGTLTTAGATVKQAVLSYAGTLTSSGAASTVIIFGQSLAGTLTTSGAIVRRTATTVAGTLTMAGAAVKETTASLAGTLTSSGSVTTLLGGVVTALTTLTLKARSFALSLVER
jgi:hypothetical protein